MASNSSSSSSSSVNPLKGLERTVGPALLEKIQTSRILVVGSGGIGCELLKDLALSGFRSVQVIDLDTIDVSNLNRQLLFRSQHVGMAKCTVACQVAADMVVQDKEKQQQQPPIEYQAHHGNVCDATKFNVPWLQQSKFDLVLNALDNVEARRRVNRLCLASGIPLIEAGTTGYLGQVTVIHKPSQVACYECKTQETQKVYPICTIRSTPSMPVHTIVWSKELYKLLFHSKPGESMLYEDPSLDNNDNNPEDGEENDAEAGSSSTYMEAVDKVRSFVQSTTTTTTTTSVDRPSLNKAMQELLQALFCTEIQKQLDMGRYKAAKKTPIPLDQALIDALGDDDGDDDDKMGATSSLSTTDIWSLSECLQACVACVHQAAQARQNNNGDVVVLEEFDKDNDLAMKFVTATSNLRSHVFGIQPLQSWYTAKGIAGNIIPAIATTNAVCAGLQILQAFQILKAQIELKKDGEELQLKDKCYYVNCIRNKTRNGLYLTASRLEDPNETCFVCRQATIPLALDTKTWTLDLLLTKVIKSKLGFENPTIMLDGDIVWEEGEGADEEEYRPNLTKTLQNLPCGGIQHGTIVELDDVTQNLTIQVAVTHKDNWQEEQGEGESTMDEEHPFLVGAAPPAKAAPVAKPTTTSEATPAKSDDGDDDIVLVLEDEGEQPPLKKPKTKDASEEDEKETDVVVLVDDDDDNIADQSSKGAALTTTTTTTNPDKKRRAEDGDAEPTGESQNKKQKTDVIEIDDD